MTTTRIRVTRRGFSWRSACTAAAVAVTLSSAAHAADPFGQGTLGITLGIGAGSVGSESYTNIGLGVNYFLLNGLWAGLYAETRQGIDPEVTKVSPEIGYVLNVRAPVKPYIAGFYRRYDVEGFDSFDSYGGRAGVYLRVGGNAYLGIGAVQEELRDCNSATSPVPCSDSYGEFSLVFHL
jgi:hypothetical protein